jgi:hypothetical protein
MDRGRARREDGTEAIPAKRERLSLYWVAQAQSDRLREEMKEGTSVHVDG